MNHPFAHALWAVAALAMLLLGFTWLGQSERRLLHQMPGSSLFRYALDRALPDLPERVAEDSLWRLCKERPFLARLWGARMALAACLDGSLAKAPVADLRALWFEWQAALTGQIGYALRVESITAEEALPEYQRLRGLHRRLQLESGGPILRAAERLGLALSEPRRSRSIPDSTEIDAGAVSRLFVSSRKYTEERLAVLMLATPDGTAAPDWLRVRDLGLLAAGRALAYENARVEPRPHLQDDRLSLNSRLEWARRAKPRAGAALESMLFGYLPMMTFSAVLALAVAVGFRASPMAVSALFLIATLGGLHLMDIALTGPEALRHLPTRDFGEGLWNLWGFGGGLLWASGLLFVFLLAATRAVLAPGSVRFFDRLLRLPLRLWAVALLAGFAPAFLAPVGSAARTELFVLLAAIASGLVIARYAPLIGIGASPAAIALYAAPLLIAGACASLLGNLVRADLGALAVAVLAGLVAMAILMQHWALRLGLGALFVASLSAYARFLATGEDATGIIGLLPRHVVGRLLTAHDAARHGAPDVKQVEWIIRSAERPGGSGPGYDWGMVPWIGLPGGSHAGALPVTAPSDLAFVMPAAVGGALYAFALVAGLAAILLVLVQRGFGRAFAAEARVSERFLAAAGAFGLLTALLRLVVNLGGTVQLLPLSGVPIVFLAHAPSAALFALGYAGLVLGSCSSGDRS
jgi:hypothetical protein